MRDAIMQNLHIMVCKSGTVLILFFQSDGKNSPFKTDPWDRFIRRSSAVRVRHQTLKETTLPDNVDCIINQKLYSRSTETYKSMVAEALTVTSKTQPWTSQWPVRCRPNPFIGSPDVVLDLPNLRNDFCSNLMDWSVSDYLTVAFPRSVYLWHTPSSRTLRLPAVHPSCIKWNQEGTVLFSASRTGSYKVSGTRQLPSKIRFYR
ncbi:hypothetical protein J6590_055183 [Homalodisca vitripennis]|nr:hypothetical protein J6590_055183 [Homalodisca vitripennis]